MENKKTNMAPSWISCLFFVQTLVLCGASSRGPSVCIGGRKGCFVLEEAVARIYNAAAGCTHRHTTNGSQDAQMQFESLDTGNVTDLAALCGGCVYWEFPRVFDEGVPAEEALLMKAEWLRSHGASSSLGGIARLGSAVCGFIQFGPAGLFPRRTEYESGPVSEDALFIPCLWVAPDHRGRGVARDLLAQAGQEALRRGYAALESFARRGSSNNPSGPLDLYMSCGFEIVRDDSEFPLVRKTLTEKRGGWPGGPQPGPQPGPHGEKP